MRPTTLPAALPLSIVPFTAPVVATGRRAVIAPAFKATLAKAQLFSTDTPIGLTPPATPAASPLVPAKAQPIIQTALLNTKVVQGHQQPVATVRPGASLAALLSSSKMPETLSGAAFPIATSQDAMLAVTAAVLPAATALTAIATPTQTPTKPHVTSVQSVSGSKRIPIFTAYPKEAASALPPTLIPAASVPVAPEAVAHGQPSTPSATPNGIKMPVLSAQLSTQPNAVSTPIALLQLATLTTPLPQAQAPPVLHEPAAPAAATPQVTKVVAQPASIAKLTPHIPPALSELPQNIVRSPIIPVVPQPGAARPVSSPPSDNAGQTVLQATAAHAADAPRPNTLVPAPVVGPISALQAASGSPIARSPPDTPAARSANGAPPILRVTPESAPSHFRAVATPVATQVPAPANRALDLPEIKASPTRDAVAAVKDDLTQPPVPQIPVPAAPHTAPAVAFPSGYYAVPTTLVTDDSTPPRQVFDTQGAPARSVQPAFVAPSPVTIAAPQTLLPQAASAIVIPITGVSEKPPIVLPEIARPHIATDSSTLPQIPVLAAGIHRTAQALTIGTGKGGAEPAVGALQPVHTPIQDHLTAAVPQPQRASTAAFAEPAGPVRVDSAPSAVLPPTNPIATVAAAPTDAPVPKTPDKTTTPIAAEPPVMMDAAAPPAAPRTTAAFIPAAIATEMVPPPAGPIAVSPGALPPVRASQSVLGAKATRPALDLPASLDKPAPPADAVQTAPPQATLSRREAGPPEPDLKSQDRSIAPVKSPAAPIAKGAAAVPLPQALAWLGGQVQPQATAPVASIAPDAGPAPATPASAPAAQLRQAVAALHVAADGSTQTTIRLDPAELGRVQVQIVRSHDGTASVSVVVERADTLQSLQADIGHLHQALDRAGVPDHRSVALHLAAPAELSGSDPFSAPGFGSFSQGGPGGGFQGGSQGGAQQGRAQGGQTGGASGNSLPQAVSPQPASPAAHGAQAARAGINITA